jgi:4-hydroxybenzoate polyprenyltransferase
MSFSYTFGLNYYVEREIDEQVGKNRVQGVGKRLAFVSLLLMSMGMFIIPMLTQNYYAFFLVTVYFFLATSYSLKPFYLKARGVMSILSPAICEKTIPFLFFVGITGFGNLLLTIYLSTWLSLYTMKRGLFHQIKDYRNDVKTKLRTFAVVYGKEKTIRFCKNLIQVIFVFGFIALFLFGFPLNLIIFLIIVFSNSRYQEEFLKNA